MTQETAKENLEVITAFANGETIQYLTDADKWTDLDDPKFYSGKSTGLSLIVFFLFLTKAQNKFNTCVTMKKCYLNLIFPVVGKKSS